ncbi:MAG: metal ABC transporter substrate-binding protein [Deltaproteobacteria bacterium]
MKNIKLYSLFVLVLLIAFGCSLNSTMNNKAPENNQAAKKVRIITSFYPVYISTLNVTKDISGVEVINMTKPQTGCLHDYQITTEDMLTLEAAKVFVVNGAGMESFLDKVIKQQPNLRIVEASKGIELIKNDGEENPHVWVSISNAIKQVRNISDQLAVIDPANAGSYKANADLYISKLEKEKDKMHNVLDSIKNKDIVTFHEAFPYFAKEFNLNIVGIIEREPGSEPSAGELADMIEKVKSLKVKALFAEPQYSPKAVETIARETNAKVYSLDPVVTGEMKADAYINTMDNNLKVLQEVLK